MKIDKDALLQALRDEYLIRDDEPDSHYHCNSCSCSGCSHASEDCTCTSDAIKAIIERLAE